MGYEKETRTFNRGEPTMIKWKEVAKFFCRCGCESNSDTWRLRAITFEITTSAVSSERMMCSHLVNCVAVF